MRLLYTGICMAMGAMLLAFTIPAVASGSAFSVSGQVIDRNGNPLPGADVTLVDSDYKVLGHKLTNDKGEYAFVNVTADAGTFKVQVSYTDANGTVHTMPGYYARWHDAKGITAIPSGETVIPDYPLSAYGYVVGAVRTDASSSGKPLSSIVYLADTRDNMTYYEAVKGAEDGGIFQFYVPPGAYVLYAQHWENGIPYESPHKQIAVDRNADATEAAETMITIPLTSPVSSPDPSIIPVHHDNNVTGTVVTRDGRPVKGATVTLLQILDDGTGYVPMNGAGAKPLTTVTDKNGNYRFDGISPTSDDGKPIQSEKSIAVMVGFTDSSGANRTITSDPEALYYPDAITGRGGEGRAHSVTIPVTLPISAAPQPTASGASASAGSSGGVAVVPLLLALALGLACMTGLYVFLGMKR